MARDAAPGADLAGVQPGFAQAFLGGVRGQVEPVSQCAHDVRHLRIDPCHRRGRPLGAPRARSIGPGRAIKRRRARHRHGATSTAGIEMGHAALLGGHGRQSLGIVGEENAERRHAHGAAIPGVGRRRAGLRPPRAGDEPRRGAMGARARPDRPADAKQLRHAGGERRRLPTTRVAHRAKEYAGELGIVAVLAEGKVVVGSRAHRPGAELGSDIRFGESAGGGLHDEPQRVAEREPEQGARDPIWDRQGRHAHRGTNAATGQPARAVSGPDRSVAGRGVTCRSCR